MACRFQELPPYAGRLILRDCGPAVRRASHLLRDTFGPLDGVISLDSVYAKRLAALLARRPTSFLHATTLHIDGCPTDLEDPIHLGADVLRALPIAFPEQRSLTFGRCHFEAHGADLSELGPLRNRLTSIVLPNPVTGSHAAAAICLQQFTAPWQVALE